MKYQAPRRALLRLLLVAASTSGASELSTEARFMEAVARHLPSSERPDWEAYIASVGIESMTKSYFAVGTGMCGFLRQGVPAKDLIENFGDFYGLSHAQAFADAAREVICPDLTPK